MNKYATVIGLEVHVELRTKSKMFCGCSADYFGKEPNTHTCPVCLGLPGALPVPNKKAIEWCVMIGMALNCEVLPFSKFDRKNYFYPDLAKGYQISQYDQPFSVDGWIDLREKGEGRRGKKIRIRRVHMEEDTAKLTHATVDDEEVSLVDFNRSGVPLVEIVTEPDFESAEEVVEYLKKLQQIVRYLGVSNADMEKGDMRLEPNISLRVVSSRADARDPKGISPYGRNDKLPRYKVEVKNINSFRFVEKAIAYEITRQSELLDNGETPAQETRGYSEAKNKTISQRSKEEAHDYRYFPEPDIPPIRWGKGAIRDIRNQMPELPDLAFERIKKTYALPDYDVEILTRERVLLEYFEEVMGEVRALRLELGSKTIANWIINKKVDIAGTNPQQLVTQIKLATAPAGINEGELYTIVKEVIKEQHRAVTDYKNGKETVIMFLVGQVMRKAGKKIDAEKVKQALIKTLQT